MDAPTDVLPVLQSKEERRRYYDRIARIYDWLAERSEQPIRQRALELLAARPGERVLEIGFGTGHCLAELARRVGPAGRVWGVDISRNMAAAARRLLEQQGVLARAGLCCADAERLPLADEVVDAVFMSFTLELFDTPEIPRVLAACRRVLRAGGRLAVAALSKEGGATFAVRAFEWTHARFPNLMDCRPIYARRFIEAAGLQVKAAEQRRMWVPVEIVVAEKPRPEPPHADPAAASG